MAAPSIQASNLYTLMYYCTRTYLIKYLIRVLVLHTIAYIKINKTYYEYSMSYLILICMRVQARAAEGTGDRAGAYDAASPDQ